VAHRKKNLRAGAIIGGTLGGVALLGLLTGLWIVRPSLRRQAENKRWTFYQDKMVRPPIRLSSTRRKMSTRRMPTRPAPTHPAPTPSPPAPTRPGPAPIYPAPTHLKPTPSHRTATTRFSRMTESSIYSQSSSYEDINQTRLLHDDILSAFPIVMMSSPSRPRMAYPRPRPLPLRPVPLRPLPPPPDQEDNLKAVKKERNQMTELEKNTSRRTKERVFLDDSQGRVTWM
jgi:hypothetical protein